MTEDISRYVQEVLEKGYLMSLATVDTAGPWVADVVYVHKEDFSLYWGSHILSRHSRALERNALVAASITLTQRAGEPDIGLQIAGKAQKVDSGLEELGVLYQRKKGRTEPFLLREGYAWYCLRPSFMDLTYEPEFGWVKKKFHFLV